MGILYGLVSSATFGLISFFTLPLMLSQVSMGTILVYRFSIATALMALILLPRKEKIWIGLIPFLKMGMLSIFYMLAVLLFFQAFAYLPSGIVATLQFQYPVMVALIMVCFFHERFRWQTGVALALAIAGVALLSLGPVGEPVMGAPESVARIAIGVTLGLVSGLCNGLYYVAIQVTSLPKMNGLVMTFYVMFFGAVFCLVNALVTNELAWVSTTPELVNLFLLALVTAVISNLTLVLAIRAIGSTLTSILGVMEPLTAVAVGCFIFGEPFTSQLAIGALLIVGAVILVLLAPAKSKHDQKKTCSYSQSSQPHSQK